MNNDISAFVCVHLVGDTATHPLLRRVGRLPLSRLVAGHGLPPRCFDFKDADPLRAEAGVESYAASTRPNAPSSASNCGF